jgi:hypothetical protein
MSLLSIAEAVNDLARLLEAKGLKHPKHAQHVAPARERIKAVLVHYFERQRVAMLKDLKPKIDRELRLYPPPVAVKESEAWEDEARIPSGEPGAGEWTSGGAGAVKEEMSAETRERVERAKSSAVRTGQQEQAIADRSEKVLSEAIGIPRTPDNAAFDLRNDDVGIEVKTLVNGKNEKITMSKTALGRKIAEQRADELKAYTVVVDRRTGGLHGQATYYYREGLGSFRLGSMTKTTLSELRGIVRS